MQANATRQNFQKNVPRMKPRAKAIFISYKRDGSLIESAKVVYGKSCQHVKSVAAHGINDKGRFHLDGDSFKE